MYTFFGLKRMLQGALYLGLALFALISLDVLGLPQMRLASQVSTVAAVVLGVLTGLGQTRAFPWMCRRWPLRLIVPDLDGTYEVEISSNWSVIAAGRDGRPPAERADGRAALFEKVGQIVIRARLFRIDVTWTSEDGYSSSRALACHLRENEAGDGDGVLFYIYRATVPEHLPGDSRTHDGAARIEVPVGRPFTVLEGHYWTDRNWPSGENTAGRLRLSRIAPS